MTSKEKQLYQKGLKKGLKKGNKRLLIGAGVLTGLGALNSANKHLTSEYGSSRERRMYESELFQSKKDSHEEKLRKLNRNKKKKIVGSGLGTGFLAAGLARNKKIFHGKITRFIPFAAGTAAGVVGRLKYKNYKQDKINNNMNESFKEKVIKIKKKAKKANFNKPDPRKVARVKGSTTLHESQNINNKNKSMKESSNYYNYLVDKYVNLND